MVEAGGHICEQWPMHELLESTYMPTALAARNQPRDHRGLDEDFDV